MLRSLLFLAGGALAARIPLAVNDTAFSEASVPSLNSSLLNASGLANASDVLHSNHSNNASDPPVFDRAFYEVRLVPTVPPRSRLTSPQAFFPPNSSINLPHIPPVRTVQRDLAELGDMSGWSGACHAAQAFLNLPASAGN